LRLDPAAHRATLNGQPLDLTPTEFSLLDVLLGNPGRAFSRSYLLDTVWGQSYVGGDRSVDNAMLRLRKKLGPLGDAIDQNGVGLGLALVKELTEAMGGSVEVASTVDAGSSFTIRLPRAASTLPLPAPRSE